LDERMCVPRDMAGAMSASAIKQLAWKFAAQ